MSVADPDAPAPRRILLYGATGSGKTTAAQRIAERLGVPVILADEIGWLPNWMQRPPEEQIELIEHAIAGGEWILDSAYSAWQHVVLPHVDLIVALDYPRWFSLQRLVRRTVRRVASREELFAGNRESWRLVLSRDSIIVWHFRSWRDKRQTMRAWAADPDAPPVLLVRRARDMEKWIASL